MKTPICRNKHENRRMAAAPGTTRTCTYLLCLTAWLSSGATHASAQSDGAGAPTPAEDGNIRVVMLKAGEKTFPDQQRSSRPIDLSACAQGSIEVNVAGLPSGQQFPYLEVWYSTGAGACNRGDRASRVDSAQNCTKLSSGREGQPIDSSTKQFDTTVDIAPVCQLNPEQTGGADGQKTVWFLLLKEPGSAETAEFYRAFTFSVDTTAPDAPANIKLDSSDSDVRVTWDAPATASIFVIVADTSGESGKTDAGPSEGECTSSLFREGERFEPDAEPDGLLVRATRGTQTVFHAGDFNCAKQVPVAIVAQDLAGNSSVVSKVTCIDVP